MMVKLPVFNPDAPPRPPASPYPTDFIVRALQLACCSQKVLGGHLEISKSRMSRIVHGDRLGFENCLKLSIFLREDPVVVLRAYRYTRLSEIWQELCLERGYVSPERARTHAALDLLPSDELRLVGMIVDRLLSAHGALRSDTLRKLPGGGQ
jgi:hypothetical protein